MNILLSEVGKSLLIIGILLVFFGLVCLLVIYLKNRIPGLQIEKEKISEQEFIKEELDRILVPVDDDKFIKKDDTEGK